MFESTVVEAVPEVSPGWHEWPPEYRPAPDDVEPSDAMPPLCTSANTRPSGWLALELEHSTADTSLLADDALIEAIVGFDRVSSWALARQSRLLAEFLRRRPGDDPAMVQTDKVCHASRYAPDEVGAALKLARGTAMLRLFQSARLDAVLAATRQAWEDGLLDAGKVRALCEATATLTAAKAVEVERRVLARAVGQSLGQLRAALAKAVIAVDPEGAAERHRAARRDRRVVLGDEQDGMASLWALLAAPDALSCHQWLTRLAHGLGKDDPRPMGARRADLLTELLTGRLVIVPAAGSSTETACTPGMTRGDARTDVTAGGAAADGDVGDEAPNDGAAAGGAAPAGATPKSVVAEGAVAEGAGASGSPEAVAASGTGCSCESSGAAAPGLLRRPVAPGKPLVQVVMPFDALTGADDGPCELVGYGAIPAEQAREIAAEAVWRRLVSDPLSGSLLDYGRTTYHPPAALADFVRGRDVYCRFPFCRRRAADAELDHTTAWTDDGVTSDENLYAACPQHHMLKHHGGWTVAQQPDGRITWTTPTGHRYTSDPHDLRSDPPPRRPSMVDLCASDTTRVDSSVDPPPF